MLEAVTITSGDGTELEGEFRPAHETATNVPRAAAVLCHPHPQYGGSMRSMLIGELFRELPAHGVDCLRFNFRGVENSDGAWDEGRGERLDVQAAVDAAAERLGAPIPLVLAGWSFGADMALSTNDGRIAAWYAVAPPLRFSTEEDIVGLDPRPKHLVLAERDQVRAPGEIAQATAHWTATELEVVPGADHFFLGRSDRVTAAAIAFVDQLTTTR